jgi:hypothetical protein
MEVFQDGSFCTADQLYDLFGVQHEEIKTGLAGTRKMIRNKMQVAKKVRLSYIKNQSSL